MAKSAVMPDVCKRIAFAKLPSASPSTLPASQSPIPTKPFARAPVTSLPASKPGPIPTSRPASPTARPYPVHCARSASPAHPSAALPSHRSDPPSPSPRCRTTGPQDHRTTDLRRRPVALRPSRECCDRRSNARGSLGLARNFALEDSLILWPRLGGVPVGAPYWNRVRSLESRL